MRMRGMLAVLVGLGLASGAAAQPASRTSGPAKQAESCAWFAGRPQVVRQSMPFIATREFVEYRQAAMPRCPGGKVLLVPLG